MSVFPLLLVLQALLGACLAGLCWAPSRLQVPKLGESSSCPGPHSFHTLFPLYIGILAISGLKFLKSTQGSYKQFRMLRGGAARILGCSGGLETLLDAQRGCKHFGMLNSKGSFSERGCARVFPRLGCFCWASNLFRLWSHWIFLLVHLKECLGELQGGSFSKFTFMKYE